MPPVASFAVEVFAYTVNVDASASTPSEGATITSYGWNWGDGSIGNGMTASHTYAVEGAYTITLTVFDTTGTSASTTWDVIAAIIENQFRYALEVQTTPDSWEIPLNPGPVHDHDSAYIYRILPLPVDILLRFDSGIGTSYVEVFDSDNQRFLLTEKTMIGGNAYFTVPWDGRGVFEVRVWKNSLVTGIFISYVLPPEEVITAIAPEMNIAPWILAGGLSIGSIAGATRYYLKRGKK